MAASYEVTHHFAFDVVVELPELIDAARKRVAYAEQAIAELAPERFKTFDELLIAGALRSTEMPPENPSPLPLRVEIPSLLGHNDLEHERKTHFWTETSLHVRIIS